MVMAEQPERQPFGRVDVSLCAAETTERSDFCKSDLCEPPPPQRENHYVFRV
jgi:hypothetical protein